MGAQGEPPFGQVLGAGQAAAGELLDPSFAPGTGTPEAGGLTSRELLRVLRGLTDVNVVSADLVEVAPAYDHAEITAIAAATVIFDIIALMALAGR